MNKNIDTTNEDWKDVDKSAFHYFICKTAMHITASGTDPEIAVDVAEKLAELLYTKGYLK